MAKSNTKVDLPKAPEPSKERTRPEIDKEYSYSCAKLGQTQYQIFQLQKEAEILNETIRDLNLEAAKMMAKEAAAKEAANKEEGQTPNA